MTPNTNAQYRQQLLVSTQRVELIFKNGGRARLHNVLTQCGADRYLRAVPHATGHYLVDVRKLAPQLGEELCTTKATDVPYLLYMTFKLKYRTAADFMRACAAHHIDHAEVAA